MNPGEKLSRVRLLADGPEALDVWLAVIGAARERLDLQYYLWHGDDAGSLVASHVLAAGDRGVRVRLLLDDIDTGGRDAALAAFNSHPNIEVRLFNPFRYRWQRWLRPLEGLTRFRELNRRMHNKAMAADGMFCVVGGRNVGDEYFGLHPKVSFDDVDLLATGVAAAAVGENFDAYWRCRRAVPLHDVIRGMGGEEPGVRRAALDARAAQVHARLRAMREDGSPGLGHWLSEMPEADVRVLSDPPDKSWNRKARKRGLASKLGQALELAREEVLVVSPYFVPRRGVLDQISRMLSQGVRVRVLTNSQASNDVVAVHAGYAPKRRRLLRDGVELFELQPDAAQLRASGKARIQFHPSGGRTSLHAKIFIIDRTKCFIGSFNLDPRSARLNTEMGLMVHCPEIARQAASYAESLIDSAYRLSLDPSRAPLPGIVWDGPDGSRHTQDPHTGRGSRWLVRLLSLLPIEAQL